jgi:uncharacterized membrane protein
MGLFNKKPKFLFSKEEEREIVNSIREAESQTSGEIRIHVEPTCGEDSFQRAFDLFKELEMDRTELHNAVLFYIAYESHKFSIVADEGINALVPEHFWEDMKDLLCAKFKAGEFVGGLKEAMVLTGDQLKKYFPHGGDTDKNEISDELSKG